MAGSGITGRQVPEDRAPWHSWGAEFLREAVEGQAPLPQFHELPGFCTPPEQNGMQGISGRVAETSYKDADCKRVETPPEAIALWLWGHLAYAQNIVLGVVGGGSREAAGEADLGQRDNNSQEAASP